MAKNEKKVFMETLRLELHKFIIAKRDVEEVSSSELHNVADFANEKFFTIEKSLDENDPNLKEMIKIMKSDDYLEKLNEEYLKDKAIQEFEEAGGDFPEFEEAGGDIDVYAALDKDLATRYRDIVMDSHTILKSLEEFENIQGFEKLREFKELDKPQSLKLAKLTEFQQRLPMYHDRLIDSINSGKAEDIEKCLKAMENLNKRYEAPEVKPLSYTPGFNKESESRERPDKTDNEKLNKTKKEKEAPPIPRRPGSLN